MAVAQAIYKTIKGGFSLCRGRHPKRSKYPYSRYLVGIWAPRVYTRLYYYLDPLDFPGAILGFGVPYSNTFFLKGTLMK